MDGACSINGRDTLKPIQFCTEGMKVEDHMEELDAGKKIL
jgi:hypothetical protein